MDARAYRPRLGLAIGLALSLVLQAELCQPTHAQFGRKQQYAAQTPNFIIFADSPQWAQQVAQSAEKNRRELAIYWLGEELPPWSERVPVHVEAAPNLGAGGETRFLLNGKRIGNWMMIVQGTQERVLDSVLPHEITHTIFATHFARLGKYVPRWADEGACTTVEHESEKRKHRHFLQEFLRTGRGLAFNTMFNLKDYPPDILPLYAQGHSAVQFLLDQGGPRKFVGFLEQGMQSEAWAKALKDNYDYDSLGQFQTLWNKWLADGSPENLIAYAPGLRDSNSNSPSPVLASSASSSLASNASANSIPPVNVSAMASDPVSLASNLTSNSPPLGNESWYKRRLQEVSGGQKTTEHSSTANPVATLSGMSADATTSPSPSKPEQAYALQPYQFGSDQNKLAVPPMQAAARPQPSQSTQVKVLDWGSSVPVPGIERTSTQSTQTMQLVPIYR